MFAPPGQPYSTKPLRGLPAQEQFYQVDVENEWDFVAEVAVGPSAQYRTQLDQLVILLESHGVVVHKLTDSQLDSAGTPLERSHSFAAAPPSTSAPEPLAGSGVLFSRDVALVHGTRVIQSPPSSHPESQRSDLQTVDSLFTHLENAGAEVIRWLPDSSADEGQEKAEETLVAVSDGSEQGDKGEEDARFCPSDILIISPMLLITRLSTFTNNNGLKYLWSVLSKPPREGASFRSNGTDLGAHGSSQSRDDGHGRPTTLLVRITDSDSPSPPPSLTASSPLRSPKGGTSPEKRNKPYIPLSRALVPINNKVMLYDPMLVAEGEARRLKSVLDRVQEDAGDTRRTLAVDSGTSMLGHRAKQDSVASYGTFGSMGQVDEDGWRFIGVDGLHLTSILLVSPKLALISLVTPPSPLEQSYPDEKHLSNVTQILESLGLRAARILSPDPNQWPPNRGVRDVILVLRRESDLEATEAGDNLNNGDDQQDQDPAEGCFEAICASLSALICGSSIYNEISEEDVSENS